MATNILDAFFVTFGLDASGFKDSAAEVDRTSKRTRDEVRKTFSGLEDQGKNLGQAFRTVRNEAIGLFLAFTGASSLTGFISGMISTSATADRLGQTLGMTTGRVVAWRQAMKEIGGSPGSADAALQAMERATQNYRLTGSSGMDADLLGLGINRSDLLGKDPGQLLVQMARARDHMSGPEFAARLGRAGMPQEMTYFLQQGGDKVAKMIAAYEKNSSVYEKQASEAEKLQKSLADLNNTLMKELVPPVTKIAELLNRLLGHFGETTPALPGIGGKPMGTIAGIPYYGPAPGGKDTGSGNAAQSWLETHGVAPDVAMGIAAGIYAEGGGLGMAKNGAFGIGQWRGARLARLRAQFGANPTFEQQMQFLMWELKGGDPGGKDVLSSHTSAIALWAYITKFMRPQGAHWEHLGDWLGDMKRGSGYVLRGGFHANKGGVHIHKIVVNTHGKDGHKIAHDISHNLKKRGIVARADGGVAP